GGRLAYPGVELRPAPALLAEDQRFAVRLGGGPVLNQVEHAGQTKGHGRPSVVDVMTVVVIKDGSPGAGVFQSLGRGRCPNDVKAGGLCRPLGSRGTVISHERRRRAEGTSVLRPRCRRASRRQRCRAFRRRGRPLRRGVRWRFLVASSTTCPRAFRL